MATGLTNTENGKLTRIRKIQKIEERTNIKMNWRRMAGNGIKK
jgi:hypothetical protein